MSRRATTPIRIIRASNRRIRGTANRVKAKRMPASDCAAFKLAASGPPLPLRGRSRRRPGSTRLRGGGARAVRSLLELLLTRTLIYGNHQTPPLRMAQLLEPQSVHKEPSSASGSNPLSTSSACHLEPPRLDDTSLPLNLGFVFRVIINPNGLPTTSKTL